MATKIPIPKLGQSEETVTIEKWRVKVGDVIKKGDILFEVETDKAVLEVESQFEGTVLKIVIPAGKEVPVMSIAAVVGEKGEAIPDIEQPAAPAPVEKKSVPPPVPAAKISEGDKAGAAPQPSVTPQPSAVAQPTVQAHKPKPSPRARAFAKDYLIDLSKVPGSGGDSRRVTEKDVRLYLETSGYMNKKITPAAFNLAAKEKVALLEIEGSGDVGRVTLADVRNAVSERPREFSSMRRIIAQRLARSKQTIPHFYVTTSVDMTGIKNTREALKKDGISLSVNVFIIKAVAMALKDFPMLNASSDGVSASYRSKVNIGVAVSLEQGLVVPVVRNADKKALDEIQAEVSELAEKARAGKLLPDEMKGGTFSISNMGMLDVENFAAIINPGESGILAVSSTVPTPVVREGKIVVRDIMKITLSADHRVVDGADGAKFCNKVRQILESADFAS